MCNKVVEVIRKDLYLARLPKLPDEYADKRGGEFAHFYGELSTDKISQSWHLDRSAFSLPEEVMLEAEQN